LIAFFNENRYPIESGKKVAGWQSKVKDLDCLVHIKNSGSKNKGLPYHVENPLLWNRAIYNYNPSEDGYAFLSRLCKGMLNIYSRPTWDKGIASQTLIATEKKAIIVNQVNS